MSPQNAPKHELVMVLRRYCKGEQAVWFPGVCWFIFIFGHTLVKQVCIDVEHTIYIQLPTFSIHTN